MDAFFVSKNSLSIVSIVHQIHIFIIIIIIMERKDI